MPTVDDNKAIVGRWFTDFWGKTCDLGMVDEIAAPDMLLQYSLHEPRRGRDDIKAFMTDFRAVPGSEFLGHRRPDRGRRLCRRPWEGGGTHTVRLSATFWSGPAGQHRPEDALYRNHRLKLKDGKIVEEIGLDDGVTALTQLGLLKIAA